MLFSNLIPFLASWNSSHRAKSQPSSPQEFLSKRLQEQGPEFSIVKRVGDKGEWKRPVVHCSGWGTMWTVGSCWSHVSGLSQHMSSDPTRRDLMLFFRHPCFRPSRRTCRQGCAVATPNDRLISMTASVCPLLSLLVNLQPEEKPATKLSWLSLAHHSSQD